MRMIFGRSLDETIRVLLAHLDRGAGLQQPHLFDHVQDQIGDLVDAVRTILVDAPQVDLAEVGVGAALLRRNPYFGRRRLVVELDP